MMLSAKSKIGLVVVIAVILVIGAVVLMPRKTKQEPNVTNPKPVAVQDPLNLTYSIEGKDVVLKNGQAESEIVPGAVSKIFTKVFDTSAKADINHDGLEDTVLILTQEQGGSGVFFYVAAAVKTASGYSATNAILLGDRIAPQNVEIRESLITVNYAERKTGEGFNISPSVGVSKYLNYYNGSLVERPEALQVENPYLYQAITSPLKITGLARGTWFFEGSFPVTLTNDDGAVIAQGVATSKSDWMTQNFIKFEATLVFTKPEIKNTGWLILKKDNPSGIPQNNVEYKMPIIFQ